MAPLRAPLPKRLRFRTVQDADADAINFPRSTQDIQTSDWFTAMARAHNTLPEFVFVTALSTTACVMGPKAFISVQDTYSEPTNMFTACMDLHDAEKVKTFCFGVTW